MRKQVEAAENRARAVLLENHWRLRAGSNPAVLVAEQDGRVVYDSTFVGIVGRALMTERPRFTKPKTREGKAQAAARTLRFDSAIADS